MPKFWLLVKQLYKQKVKAKSFVFTIALYAVILAGILFWNDISELLFSDEPMQAAVIDETGAGAADLLQSTDDLEVAVTDLTEEEAKEQVMEQEMDVLVTLADDNGNLAATIYTYEPLSFTTQTMLSSQLDYAGKLYAVQQMNLTTEQAEQVLGAQAIVDYQLVNEEAADGKSESQKAAGIGVSYFIGFLIYFFVMTFLSMITTDVASEKGSRVLEVLLATIKPTTHFLAKVIGTLLVALTQLLAVAAVAVLLLVVADDGSRLDFVQEIVSGLSGAYVAYTTTFLMLTLIFYLIFGALLGSLVSKVEEASQALVPAMMMALSGFYVLITGSFNPDTMLIKVFSYLPFSSGMVMPLRIGATDMPIWEAGVSLLILAVTVALLFYFTMYFYKRSVLTYTTGGILQKFRAVFKHTT